MPYVLDLAVFDKRAPIISESKNVSSHSDIQLTSLYCYSDFLKYDLAGLYMLKEFFYMAFL